MTTATAIIADKPVEAGDPVLYQDAHAVIVRVRAAGLADLADLAVYREGAAPELLTKVARGLGENEWCLPTERPRRPPTVAEVLDAAEAAGQRVPHVGEVVRIIRYAPASGATIELTSDRARVVEVLSPTKIKAVLFTHPEAPEDGEDPVSRHVQAYSLGGFPGHFNWSDWVPPAPVNRFHKRRLCRRCSAEVRELRSLYRDDRRTISDNPVVDRLCDNCVAALVEFATIAPEPALAGR